MIILAYGIKQPTTGDRGSVFFPALEELCQRVASHKHNDIDSTPVSGASIVSGSVNALSTSWSLVSPGLYQQDVTLPAGFTVANSILQFRLLSTDEIVYPKVEKLTTTSIRISANLDDEGYRVCVK